MTASEERNADIGAGLLGERAREHLRALLPPGADEELMLTGMNLVRASGAFVSVTERKILRSRGLRWASFSVLFMVSTFPGVEARTIAKLTGVTRQATSLVLTALEKAGRITRARSSASDRRLLGVRLTEEGAAVLRDAMTEQSRNSEEWFKRLDPEEQKEFGRLLQKLLVGTPEASEER